MKLAIAWVIGAATAAGMAYAYDSYRPALPYTEPHHEFTTDAGDDCVAWRFNSGAVVAFCDGVPPVIVAPKRECGLTL